MAAFLREPVREVSFRVPVRMDDGTVSLFWGYRVHHNDALGPAKGGVRFHPAAGTDIFRAKAMWTTWRCALLDIPLGGAYGGVVCDPHGLSAAEQERLCRGWVRRLARCLGPDEDVPEPDLGTNAQHMLWMLDEYETIAMGKRPGAFTGKPVGMGGSLGRLEATGYGLVFTVREALKELGVDPGNARASVQGFGAVGQSAARLFRKLGGEVACVAAWEPKEGRSVAFSREGGVDVDELAGITDASGTIDRVRAIEAGYQVGEGDEWLARPVDVLIPAALEQAITEEQAARMPPRVRIVAEGADGATTPEADALLSSRGVIIIPDFLANAGGVTCSYFEQVQAAMNFYWQKEEVLARLDRALTEAFVTVSEMARTRKVTLRDAAHVIAVSRVAAACRGRGWV
ncbi:MAG: Glu/Leu/Phe/Val family dehydrogenase [Acidobacteriota bacterium]